MKRPGTKLCVIIAGLTACLQAAGFGQGAYLKTGVNGIFMAGEYRTNDAQSGAGGTAGFSIAGRYDFHLSVTRLSFDAGIGWDDVSGLAVAPGVTFHVLKQGERSLPFSVALSAVYEGDSYSSDKLEAVGWTLSSDRYAVGPMVYMDLRLSETGYLQPALWYTYERSSLELEDRYGVFDIAGRHDNIVGFSAALVLRAQQSSDFIIKPGILLGKDRTTYSVLLGFIHPLP